jgi:hypothetical protein
LKASAKLLSLFFCLSILFLACRSEASTQAVSSPGKPEVLNENWQFVASDENGGRYFYNSKALERGKDNHVKLWVRAIYSEKNPKYTQAEFQWEMDCTKKSMRGLSAKASKKDGTAEIITESSDWSPIPAESVAETMHDTVCKKKEMKNP